MELALTNVTCRLRPHPISLLHPHPHPHRPFSKSTSLRKSTPFSSCTPIKASFRNHNFEPRKPQMTNIVNPAPLSFLKSTFIAGVTVTALLFSRFTVKPSVATPISSPPPPASVETTDSTSEHLAEEKALEEHICSHPYDTKALRSLMEVKIKIGKIQEAIAILNQLIDLEPEDSEWQLLKHHLHSYDGDHESAKLGFEEILSKDPLRVEAYHGLVMAAAAKESPTELLDVEKKIMEAMDKCKKDKKKDDLRDFKLLLAQIRVIQGDHNEALKIYQELCKEEPRDFRPYLCQGIIYSLLGKNDDAERNFERYRRLVPKGHPYTKYFDDNMVATKVFAQKVENERAYSKS